jgi:two-component system, NtrC family, sensor kinase
LARRSLPNRLPHIPARIRQWPGPPAVNIGAMDAVGRSLTQSAQAMEKKAHGPVYFRREREAYVTLTLLRTQGLAVGEINLKPIQDMLSKIKLSEHAQVNAIDAQGRLVFPDISLTLDNTNVTQFAQVRAARRAAASAVGGPVQRTTDILGRELLTAYAPVEPLGWQLFVELPTDEPMLAR